VKSVKQKKNNYEYLEIIILKILLIYKSALNSGGALNFLGGRRYFQIFCMEKFYFLDFFLKNPSKLKNFWVKRGDKSPNPIRKQHDG